jgi:tetratricopeptide (TPR) repeat protein
MKESRRHFLAGLWLICAGTFLISGCAHNIPRLGSGGRYQEGRDQFLRGRAGDMDTAVVALESVAKENPTYKDTLTLLGMAYYRKGRFQDAHAVLQRALAVNQQDEIAWLALGLAQLRLGQETKGLESLKGGITLLAQVSKQGYRDFEEWDSKGSVRASLRRSAFLAQKGLEEKENLIRSTEQLIARTYDEEAFWKVAARQEHRRGFQSP